MKLIHNNIRKSKIGGQNAWNTKYIAGHACRLRLNDPVQGNLHIRGLWKVPLDKGNEDFQFCSGIQWQGCDSIAIQNGKMSNTFK